MLRALIVMIHVVAAVLWIGGIGFATLVVLPSAVRQPSATGKAQVLMRNAEGFRKYVVYLFIPVVGVTGVLNLWFLGFPSPSSPLGLKVYPMAAIYIVLSGLVLGMPHLLKKMQQSLTIDDMVSRVYRMHWIVLSLGIAAVVFGVSVRTL